MSPYLNAFTFQGEIAELKECKRKDGTIWGYSVKVAQAMGLAACEFLIEFDDWKSLQVGQPIQLRGHFEQSGFDLRARVDLVEAYKADGKDKQSSNSTAKAGAA